MCPGHTSAQEQFSKIRPRANQEVVVIDVLTELRRVLMLLAATANREMRLFVTQQVASTDRHGRIMQSAPSPQAKRRARERVRGVRGRKSPEKSWRALQDSNLRPPGS